ncbi:hypothetical protein EOM09_00835 [bacterium]|nr:hypothetical protein [bacterium]
MKKVYSINEKDKSTIESIRKNYRIIYNYLISLDFIPELISIKEKNSENKKLGSILVFFGASYFKKYANDKKILENQKNMRIIISVLFDILGADLAERILWVIYSKKEFLEIKEEVLKFDFEGKKIIKSYF